MRWASVEDPSHWTSLRDSGIQRSAEPDHLRMSFEAVANLKQQGMPIAGDAVKRYLDEREQAGAELSEEDRRMILDNYFAISYTEPVRS